MEKQNFIRNILRSLSLLLIFLFLFSEKSKAQTENATSIQLRKEINSTDSDSTKARLYGLLAWELKFTNKQEALQFAEKEIMLAYSLNNNVLKANGFRVKALTLVIDEKIAEGMALYDSAIVYARRANSLYYEASCYSLMAGMYGDHSDYDKAIELYSKGLEVAQRLGDPRTIAVLSNNLAESYQCDGRNAELAKKYFLIALSNSVELRNWPVAGMNAANLAKEYLRSGEKEKTLEELQHAVNYMMKDTTDAYQYGTTCHVLASIYFDLEKYNETEKYGLISLRIMDELKHPDNALRPLTVLANMYIAIGKIQKAKEYSERLLKEAIVQSAKIYIRDGYKALSDLERKKGKTNEALKYYELYKNWNDSVFEMKREQNISNMETLAKLKQKETEVKYETEKKTMENESLKKLNLGLRFEKVIAIIACLIFLGLSTLLYFSYTRTKKINEELQIEKKIVELQAAEKSMLVNEIHHRVKNNLTMLKSLLYLQARTSVHSDTKKILEECQTRIQSMALVHQNLYEGHNEGALDFISFLENMFSELSVSFRSGENEVIFNVEGSCKDLSISQAIPLGLIMNELATNSLKYAFKEKQEGTINVNISEVDKQILIVYSDNGPGLTTDFDIEKGGFGFKLIAILCKQLNAFIFYEQQKDLCVFRIKLPVT